MNEKRRALGRGLGALIPAANTAERPVDVFFGDANAAAGTVTAPRTTSLAGALPPAPTTTPGEDELVPVPGAACRRIPSDAIRPSPKQPRTGFDEDDMGGLVHSIREIGVLQPIVVRPLPLSLIHI